jgi:hypothetical protein
MNLKLHNALRVVAVLSAIICIYFLLTLPLRGWQLTVFLLSDFMFLITSLAVILFKKKCQSIEEGPDECLSPMTTDDAVREADWMSQTSPEGHRTLKPLLFLKCISDVEPYPYVRKGEFVYADFVDPDMSPNTIHIVDCDQWISPEHFHIWE